MANAEQYRTTNLITGLPRTITVSVNGFADAVYTDATDAAIARYNALNLLITFQRIANNGQIQIVNDNTLGTDVLGRAAGFPTAAGNVPADPIRLSSNTIGANPNVNYLTTVIAHEMGHTIGFRHTDYMNRAYSNCYVDAYSPANEGNAGVGAINIPGTPTAPDPNSWMLACIGTGVNRPFNANDVTALNFLYAAPLLPNINGAVSYDFYTTSSSASGTIVAAPNSTVYVTISAYGPSTASHITSFLLGNEATLSGPMGNNVHVYNSSTTQSFVMPASGSITWSAGFSQSDNQGSGHVSVNY